MKSIGSKVAPGRPVPLPGTSRRARGPAWVTVLAGMLVSTAACGGSDRQPISVLTQNLYLGANLSPLSFALTVDDLRALSAGVWREVQDSRFHERADVLAAKIFQLNPDVLALQEVSLFHTQTPGDWESGAPPNATRVELDFLQILLAALQARGARYQIADSGVFTDQELPSTAADGAPLDVRRADRNVTLVRDGHTFASVGATAFAAEVSLPVGGAGGATLTLKRGYVSTDVTVGTKTFRVVNAQLEAGSAPGRTQQQQAQELVDALAPAGGPLILTGDFDSPADHSGTTTYAELTTSTAAGRAFRDAWPFRRRSNAQPVEPSVLLGATCCVSLTEGRATPGHRIDLVLFRGAIEPLDALVVTHGKTPSGLRPSDHLGVFAELQVL